MVGVGFGICVGVGLGVCVGASVGVEAGSSVNVGVGTGDCEHPLNKRTRDITPKKIQLFVSFLFSLGFVVL